MSFSEDDLSVKVAVRIRPQVAREVIDGCRICTNVIPGEPQITLGSDKSFTFDYVFDTQENQQTLYDNCASSLVAGALQGYNATILAYGQTGSGKTFTMGTGFDSENISDADPSTVGIIPRAINQLFDGIQTIKQQSINAGDAPPHFVVTAQFLELYNEEIIDLFANDYSIVKTKSNIRIHEDMHHNIYVTGVSWKPINSASEALASLRQGALSRTTAATAMNSQSSRSHAVFTINIQQKRFVKHEDEGTESTLEDCSANVISNENRGEFETLSAKFHFVDLAGSERLKRTGATGDRAKEGISINCGLLVLGNVISALGDKSKKSLHVPYRDSKLTRLLQDSLGGNSRTVMIACISPSDRDFMETLNTLKYANRARNIQNKVTINQDKSSRTIQLLRQEIQQLQLEILEYKQGKRTVNENGEVCVNDTHIENTMLQTELNNMRTRLKAMQETIDVLTAKNTQLLAEKATGAWLNTDAGVESNMTDVIHGYLKEIEELRVKLLESEHMCGQLRNNATSQVKNRYMSCSNDEYSSKDLITKAKRELENEKQALEQLISVKSHDTESESSDSDSEGNSSDDENDRASVDSQYSQELANLTSEINLKQKLIEELELSHRRLSNLKQHYEDKLQQLQTTIKLTQEERDTVLSSLGSNNNQSEKVKKVQDDYERKLNAMQKELKSLQSAKKEHAKLLRDQSQYENQVRTLKYEVNDMKRTKVKLMNKIKEEAIRHHEVEMKKAKEIAQLKKESRKAEIRMKNLESNSRVREAVLKRKQEEVTALRRAAKTVNNRKGAVGSHNQKNSKQTWINLEKNISALTLNKQTLYSLEKDMERLLQERKKLRSDLDFKLKKLTEAQVHQPRDSNLHRDFEDEIEAIRANLDYVNESIKELQENILQVEDSKTVSESLELNGRVNNLPEAIYVLEKLFQMSLHNSCLAAQRDINVKELETKMQQLEKENDIQRQLIEHMLSSRERVNEMPTSMTASSDRDARSMLSSSSSSRSTSPSDLLSSTHSANSKNDYGASKHRHRAAPAQELLYASKNIDQQPPRVPLVRVPSLSSFLRPDKCKPSPVMPRKKISRQESVSPSLIRRGTFIIAPNTNLLGKPGSMDRLNKSPPNSPPTHRRIVSRDENVFSRLTSSTTQSIEHQRSKGVIQPYQGKSSLKTPLVCTHITEGHSKAVLAVYATDDMLFSASKDKTVKIWDLNNGKEIQTLGGHPNNVVAIKYDEYAQLVFSVSSSYVRVWDMRLSKSIKTLSSSGIVNNGSVMSSQIPIGEIQLNDIALNNYGRTLYMATGDKVKIWDLRKFTVRGKLISGHTAAVMCLAVGQFDNKDIIVTGSKDHYIKMFEVGEEAAGTYSPTVNLEPPHYDGIQTLALRNQILFSGSRDYAIKKWDLDKQELVTSINNAHKDWICGLAVVPDQPLLLSVCRSGSLKIWSESSCSLLGEMKAHDSPINAIATNSTHVFTAAHDGTVKLWRVKCHIDSMA